MQAAEPPSIYKSGLQPFSRLRRGYDYQKEISYKIAFCFSNALDTIPRVRVSRLSRFVASILPAENGEENSGGLRLMT